MRSLQVFEDAAIDEPCSLHQRAVTAREAGAFAQAEVWAPQALALMEQAKGADDPDMANVLLNLGGLCEDQARYGEAETHYRCAADIMTALPMGEAEDVDRLRVQALSRLGPDFIQPVRLRRGREVLSTHACTLKPIHHEYNEITWIH